MSRMNNEKDLGMTGEEKAEEQIKEWESVLYSQMYPVTLVKDFIRKSFRNGFETGKDSQKKKSAEQLDKAKGIIRDLIFDLVAVDGEQANELDSVKKAKQFFREMK